MDQELRALRRRARAGDPVAALQYYYSLMRSQDRTRQRIIGSTRIELQRNKLRGPILITPQSSAHILFSSASEPNNTGGSSTVPLRIFGVPYSVSANYYFYPDLGWTPHEPNRVQHARAHLARFVERKHSHESDRDMSFYLSKPWQGTTDLCFVCEQHLAGTSLHGTRLPARVESITIPAATLLAQALRETAVRFAQDYPHLMQAAQAVHLNNHILEIIPRVVGLQEQLSALESELSQMIIEELRLQN